MQVVFDTTIVGQVRNAILTAVANNQSIEKITLSADEMKAFINSPFHKDVVNSDKYYADRTAPAPRGLTRVPELGDVPASCYYMGVRIVVANQPIDASLR